MPWTGRAGNIAAAAVAKLTPRGGGQQPLQDLGGQRNTDETPSQ